MFRCTWKLTVHGGSFSMLSHMLEAQHLGDACSLWTVPLLGEAWDTCEYFNCLGCPVIILRCAQIKVQILKLQRNKTWLILASTYRQRPVSGKVPRSQKSMASKTRTWTIRPNHTFTKDFRAPDAFLIHICIWLSVSPEQSVPGCVLRRAMPFNLSLSCTSPSFHCNPYWLSTYCAPNPVRVGI